MISILVFSEIYKHFRFRWSFTIIGRRRNHLGPRDSVFKLAMIDSPKFAVRKKTVSLPFFQLNVCREAFLP